MTVPTIFETCKPRDDVLAGTITEADFAADLAQVITGAGSPEYRDPALFFAHTYPTRGLKNLLAHVCRRLSRAGGEVSAIFRLDTSYGGGKTHGLIALAHAARGMEGVDEAAEFVDPELLPGGPVRVAAFTGENADPANGRNMGDGVRAHTPWGELAYTLAGKAGFERIGPSDRDRVAPGAETLRELFGGEPTLILLDELSVYLRKAYSAHARSQLTAFLTSLFKAVEGTPNAALVYTLAIGKEGRATDAYSEENRFIADKMTEAEKVSARKATLLNPTEEDETVQVLRRRLFKSIDEGRIPEVADAYAKQWAAHRGDLVAYATRLGTKKTLEAGYPFHPEVLDTLTGKTATLANFQRVRGMLRLLAKTVSHLWKQRPEGAHAIHLHHIDLGHEPVRQEIVTRLEQHAYEPAITNDVAGPAAKPALAQEIDAEHYAGMAPYAEYTARTIFLHTLAFNDPLKGLSSEHLRYSVLGPGTDISFVEQARKKFVAESAYLDDRPGVPMRFLADANLGQIIRREEGHVDPDEARAQLNDRIRQVFQGRVFDPIHFPGGPYDIPDRVGDGRPKLAVLSYDGVWVGGSVEKVPELVNRIYKRKGAEGSAVRLLRNNLVFVVADDARRDEMRNRARRLLALRELKRPERLADLAEHQQGRVRELADRSEQELAVAVQQCYSHIFYPSRNRLPESDTDLAHTAIDAPSTSDKPGAGQQQVTRALRGLSKLRLPDDEPDSPTYVRDRTPLKRQGEMTTVALRDEFRRDPALPMLLGNDLFIRGVRQGIEAGVYVYRSGRLLYGPGDAYAEIRVDEQSWVFTMGYAKGTRVWPRPKPENEENGGDEGENGDEREKNGDKHKNGDQPPPKPPGEFAAEGVFREALVRVWEQAAGQHVKRIGTLDLRLFDLQDGLRLLGPAGSVAGAENTVRMTGGYETRDGGSFELEFKGPVADAEPVREFLLPQIRAAPIANLEVRFTLVFKEGFPLGGDEQKKLTERLSRFASGQARVTATATAEG